jgi:hypothetical protein
MDAIKCGNCGLWINSGVPHSCAVVHKPEPPEWVKDSYYHQYKLDVEPEGPHGWLQWKGTDACVDLYCSCGVHGHLDVDFMYHVRCKACGKLWHVSGYIRLLPVEGDDLVRYNKEFKGEGEKEFGD